jgi:hypothetical protein
LGVAEDGRVEIDSEVATGEGRDHIDLELRVSGDDDRLQLRRRGWIEVKINAEFAPEVADEGDQPGKDGQLIRYRRALTVRDALHGSLPPSPLAVLIPAIRDEDREQIDTSEAVVLYWQRVGDLAAERARELAGEDWRLEARKPSASLELANLETLVRFLESATARPGTWTATEDRRQFVGIQVTDPLTSTLIDSYAASYRGLKAIAALLERIVLAFEDDHWSTQLIEDTGTEDDEYETLAMAVKIAPPQDTGWWRTLDGGAHFQVAPIDDREPREITGPVVWAGVSFDDPDVAPKISAVWSERAKANGFVIFEDQDTATVEYVGQVQALSQLVANAPRATKRTKS